ncbi:MAG: hypothetical protein KDD29_06895 [Flavobacteriales bacterium]|nr:hypothetical protein [Flavobacteriales bacterium]MCB0539173.1 hypothetical protein [Bacteroidota bacterium]
MKQEPARLAESLMEIHDEMVYFSSWDIMDRVKKWLLDLKRVVEALGVLGDEVIKCLRALYFYMFLTI